MINKQNKIVQKTGFLCAVILMVGMSMFGQEVRPDSDTTADNMQEVIEMVERLNNPRYKSSKDEVDQMIYNYRHEWFRAGLEPDWENIEVKFSELYPKMNVDSLTYRTRFLYFHFLADTYGFEKDKENRVKALAYLANTYGERWAPGDLTSYARDVIRFDFGHDQDALRWTEMALEKIRKEPQVETQESGGAYIEEKYHTLARILAKMGRKEEALKCIVYAMSFYSIDGLYMEADGTYGRGLYKKQAMSDLFEVLIDRGRWLDIKQKKKLYKENIDFAEDKQYWQQVRDQYLAKEFPPREADSLMYMGAMYYYVTYVQDTLAWTKPFVEYVENYGNIDAPHKNKHAWELFTKSDQPEILKKALQWSRESLNDKGDPYRYAYLDTYANLQYKLGDKAGALKTIEEAISLAPDDQKALFKETQEKMKKGEETW